VSEPVPAFPLGSVAVMLTVVFALTGDEVALKVPAVAAAGKLKLAGTVATLLILIVRVTVRPARGAGPLKVSVPVELVPPVRELGLNETDVMTAGFTVRAPLTLAVPRVAFTVTFLAAATPVVVALKVWVA
jgi:hypothetical protein